MNQKLFDYLKNKHGLTLSDREIQAIENLVLDEGDTHGWTKRVEKGERVLCVVWDNNSDPSEGVTLARVTHLNCRAYYVNDLGTWYDYAEPVSPALAQQYNKWVKWAGGK